MSNYFDLQNAPVLTTPSDLTAPKITSIGYPGDDTAADPAGGQTITLTGSGFEAGASVIINGNAVGVVSVVSSTTITFTSPAQSAGSYVLYVVNTDGGTAIAVPGIQYSGTPNWTTAAGSLGSYTETVAIANTVTATGDAPITYSVFSGSLPTGATLNSANGYISGTSPAAASPTTYTFTIRATDAEQQDTNRSFSLTINPDVVTWSSPANGTTYTSVANSAISNVALSASAASGQNVSYSANTLPTGLSISGSNITGTPTVVANSSTLLTATAATTNATATRTINWVISVAADAYFPYVTSLLSANTPTSTFVTDASTNSFAVTVNGDTRPTNFGPYTPGYYSAYFDGTGDQLDLPTSQSALAFGSSDFTIEAWVYKTTTGLTFIFSGQTDAATAAGSSYGLYVTDTATTSDVYIGGTGYGVTSPNPTLNTWAHVAFVRTGGTLSTYLNGTRVGTRSDLGAGAINAGATTYPPSIGGTGFGSRITGYISNLRVIKGSGGYNATQSTITVPTAPLTAIANTSLLACQSNRLIDNSTNNFTITKVGDTTVSGFAPFTPSSSYAGYGSGYFDGAGDYLGFTKNTTTGSFTCECWFYRGPDQAGYHVIFSGSDIGGSGADNVQLAVNNSGQISFVLNATLITQSSAVVTKNAWTHIAWVRSGTSCAIFANGTRVGTGTSSAGLNVLYIGTNYGPGYTINGYISDARIVNSAIYDPAQTTIAVPTAPLTAVANTYLLTLQNNQPNNNSMFLDSSTSNFNITRNGNTTQGTFSPYGGGWSNYFDGSTDYFSMSDNNAFQYGASDFALECWVYPPATPATYSYIVSQWYTGDKGIIFGNVNGYPAFLYSTTGSNDLSVTSSTVFPVNQWSHLMACRTGNTISLYLNGTRVATTTESGTLYNSTSSIGIATHVQGLGSYLWSGYISNLRSIAGSSPYNAAQTTITVPTAPLTAVANTRLLICADNRFIDDGPSNFTLTRAGTPSVQRFNPFNPVVTTPTSYSGYFDGTGDYLSVATANAAGLSKFLTGNFTVECWAYLTDSSVDRTIISAVYLWAAGANYNIEVRSGGLMHVQIGNGITLTSGTVSWPLNQWNHVALVRTSTTSTTLYLNGVSVATSSTNWTADEDCPVTVGCFNINGGSLANYWNGYISNLRIVNGTGVYTGNFTPPTAPLTAIANTSFLTLQSATFIDNSTNNLTITNNGDTAPRQFNPFGWTSTTGSSAAYTPALYGGSGYFDGSGDGLVISSPPASLRSWATGDFTVEAWVYPTSFNGWSYNDGQTHSTLVGNRSTTNSGDYWSFGPCTDGVVRFYYYNGSSPITVSSGLSIALNQWSHVAFTNTSSGMRFYVNGVASGFTAISGTPVTGSELAFTVGVANNTVLTGYVSDLRIVNGTAVYKASFAPPVAPLTALQNTSLLTNMTGAGIYDSSMMVDYETAGNASISTSIKKYGNTSIAFDGSGDALASPANINLAVGSGDFTIEMWVNGANNGSAVGGSFPRLFTLGTAQGSGCIESYNASGTMYVDISGAGGPISFTASTLLNSTWNHYAITRSGTSLRAFVNGTQVGTTATNSTNINLAATTQSWIGAISASAGNFNGYIDDLRITKGVARYTSNFTPTSTPFITN